MKIITLNKIKLFKLMAFGSIAIFTLSVSCTSNSLPSEQQTFNKEYNKIKSFNFNVSNKQNITVFDVQENQITKPDFNKNNYELKLRISKRNQETSSIEIEIVFTDLKNSLLTESTIFTISGFKKFEADTVNEALKNIKVEYPNASQIFANQAELKQVVFSNYSEQKYQIINKNFEKNDNDITLNFQLKDKETNKLSIEKTVKISSFKHWIPQEQLDNDIQKVKITVPKNIKFADLKKESVTIRGFDDKKYFIDVEFQKDFSNLLVSWKIGQINTTNHFSIQNSMIIKDYFNDSINQQIINKQIDEVGLDYSEKEFTKVSDADKFSLIFRNLPSSFEPSVLSFVKNEKDKSVTVTFIIIDLQNKNIKSKEVTKTITGFAN